MNVHFGFYVLFVFISVFSALGGCSFLLQRFYVETRANNFMMHILVDDVQAWYTRIQRAGLVEKFNLRLTEIKVQPYRMRDFTLTDPSGVLWVIGENDGGVIALT